MGIGTDKSIRWANHQAMFADLCYQAPVLWPIGFYKLYQPNIFLHRENQEMGEQKLPLAPCVVGGMRLDVAQTAH